MDYFYVAGANNVGLLDLYLSGTYQFSPKANLYGAVHAFNSPSKIYKPGGEKMSSSLGSEFDLQFNYQVMPNVALSTGYSMYFDTETLQMIKNTPNPKSLQNWFWLSLNINPKIFNYKF